MAISISVSTAPRSDEHIFAHVKVFYVDTGTRVKCLIVIKCYIANMETFLFVLNERCKPTFHFQFCIKFVLARHLCYMLFIMNAIVLCFIL